MDVAMWGRRQCHLVAFVGRCAAVPQKQPLQA